MLSLPLWTFTGYHVALVCSGHTTKEHLKGRKHGARSALAFDSGSGFGLG